MRGGARLAKRVRTSCLDPWRRSARFREVARKSAKANLARFKRAPRCGAARKRDGRPCGNPAMKNGRCGIHGGKTPSGRQWHVVQYPNCSTPAGLAKFNRKLRQQQRYAAERAERLAAMTVDQRARHDAWHRSHRPGAKALRNADSARRRQNDDARSVLAVSPTQRAADPEAIRIKRVLSAAKARLAILEREAKAGNDDKGVFA
jgi:hypothetical protein